MDRKGEKRIARVLGTVADEAAGLTRPERREFLRRGLAFAGGAALGSSALLREAAAAGGENLPPNVPSWTRSVGPGVVTNPYGMPSSFEADVVRRTVPWLTASAISSISFTPLQDLKGIITPNGLVFERYHGGVPAVDPDEHRLMIHGLVSRPLLLTMDDLMRFPSVSMIRFIECPANGGMEWRGAQMEALQFTHGMLSCCEWTGVPLSLLLEEAGIRPEGKWILAEGADGSAMTRSIPLEKALDDSIVARHWYTRKDIEHRRATLRSPIVLRCIHDFEAGRRQSDALLSGMLPLEHNVDAVLANADLV